MIGRRSRVRFGISALESFSATAPPVSAVHPSWNTRKHPWNSSDRLGTRHRNLQANCISAAPMPEGQRRANGQAGESRPQDFPRWKDHVHEPPQTQSLWLRGAEMTPANQSNNHLQRSRVPQPSVSRLAGAKRADQTTAGGSAFSRRRNFRGADSCRGPPRPSPFRLQLLNRQEHGKPSIP